MKGDTPLDYAVFQLNESLSRCELWICAGDKNEKLASGSLKPFLTHLQAAKEQIAKGANFIILQAPPFVGDGSPWFTKRTVERFVRFVSTPDVLESVSIVEAELLKLVDATTILISDSSWPSDPLNSAPVTPRTGTVPMYKSEVESMGGQSKTYTRRSSFDYAGVALDGSKRDLLKVMETRRLMLLHEQKKTFAQATAAGFNVACISDLMVFANCFGAPRLWEACLKFMTLCKKRQEAGLVPDKTVVEGASSTSSDTDIQLLSQKSDASEGSEESVSGTSINSKAKSRKTWDPQVMSTLQQLYSRKVENACFLSPDVGKKTMASRKQNDMAEEDLVVGARESVSNSEAFRAAEEHSKLIDAVGKVNGSHGVDFKSKVDHKTISVQDAISLFESKQQKVEGIPKKRSGKEVIESEARKAVEDVALTKNSETANSNMVVEEQLVSGEAPVKPTQHEPGDAQKIFSDQNINCGQTEQPKQPSALAVVSETTELEEVDTIQWRPLSKSAGYVFDDMFLEQKHSALQNTRRQSLCSWKTTWDSDFEPFDSCTSRTGDILDVGRRHLKGRLYDEYQEKREAKLKHEPIIKKAEKDAKLKAMHDVLEKRKVELAVKSTRLLERNGNISANAIRTTIVKKEVDSRPPRRTSPSTSVHSAPPASKQDMTYPRSISARKPSPGSQKSSSATTPRASTQASCDSRMSSTHRSQRRAAAGSLHSDLGKENTDPSCNDSVTSDVEGSQHSSRSIDKKTKGLVVKRNGSTVVDSNQVRIARDMQAEHAKALRVEVIGSVLREGKPSIQLKKGKQSPQSRQSSAASAVRGRAGSSKIQKAKSNDLISVSVECMPINVDGDDAESSCSCAAVDECSPEEAAVEEMQVETTADKNLEAETEKPDPQTEMDKGVKAVQTEIEMDEGVKEIQTEVDEGVKEVQTEMDEGVKEVEVQTEMDEGVKEVEVQTEMDEGVKEVEVQTEMNEGVKEVEVQIEMDEGVKEVETEMDEGVKEVETEMDEGVREVQTGMDQGIKEADHEREVGILSVEASKQNQCSFKDVEIEAGVFSGDCELPAKDTAAKDGTLNVDKHCLVAGSDPFAAEVNVLVATERSPKESSDENKDQIAITTMDQVVAKIYQNHSSAADLTGTKTPLFELAELDYKISAATEVPLEDVSSLAESEPESSTITGGSSTGGSSIESKAGSFGSSKGELAAIPFNITDPPMVGSFLPKQKCTIFPAMLYRKSSEPRASSEPGSPVVQKLPLFDLLVTEQNAAQNVPRPSKSSSHKLPHMCRLPSPDTTRGTLLQAHKKLAKSSVAAASASASAVNMSEAKSRESLKGFKRFLRFGRKSCGSASSERIMWQNGWFRGDRDTQ